MLTIGYTKRKKAVKLTISLLISQFNTFVKIFSRFTVKSRSLAGSRGHGAAAVVRCERGPASRIARDGCRHLVALVGLYSRRVTHGYALYAMLAVGSEAPRATRAHMCAGQPSWGAFVCADLPREVVGRALGGREPAKTLLLRSRSGGTR